MKIPSLDWCSGSGDADGEVRRCSLSERAPVTCQNFRSWQEIQSKIKEVARLEVKLTLRLALGSCSHRCEI